MAGKPFSERLYDRDDNAKDIWIDWLNSQDYKAEVNPDQYGIDVLASKNGEESKFEVEVKHNWKGPRFQYGTLHYSARKKKFLGTPENTFFVTFNHERTHVLLVPGEVLANAPVIRKNTIYTQNEEFIEVTVSDCQLIDLGVSNGD